MHMLKSSIPSAVDNFASAFKFTCAIKIVLC